MWRGLDFIAEGEVLTVAYLNLAEILNILCVVCPRFLWVSWVDFLAQFGERLAKCCRVLY